MNIFQAQPQDVDKILPLFISYREFYYMESNAITTKSYLLNRIKLNESIIFYAMDDNKVLGFTQLYPSFCSIELKRVWLLYDIFVIAEHRGKGVANRLIQRAKQLAKETNSAFITLNTGITNIKAQSLYENNGFVRDRDFYIYNAVIK